MKIKLFGYYGGDELHGFGKDAVKKYYSVYASTHVDKYRIYPDETRHELSRVGNLYVNSTEICTYFTYLLNGNSYALESLFVPQDKIHFVSPEFKSLVLDKRNLFIDKGQVIDFLSGLLEFFKRETLETVEQDMAELIVNSPSIGITRRAIEKRDEFRTLGYYKADYVHAIRVTASFLYFLKTGQYPLGSLKSADAQAFETCVAINNDAKFSKNELDAIAAKYLMELEKFSLDEEEFRFDSGYVLGALKEFDQISKRR